MLVFPFFCNPSPRGGFIRVIMCLAFLSCSQSPQPSETQPAAPPQPMDSIPQPAPGQQNLPDPQTITGEQVVPDRDPSSSTVAPVQSMDLLEIGKEGLVLKTSPVKPEISQSSATIQLKDPVQKIDQELDGWLDKSQGLLLQPEKEASPDK